MSFSSQYNLPEPSLLSSIHTSIVNILGFHDARFHPSDWSFERNPFWTSFLFTLIIFPCLFYLTWYLNPSLSKNRLGLSWVLGFFSATMFTLAGFYEVPHLRTIFNFLVDYQPPHLSDDFGGYNDVSVLYAQTGGSLNLGFSASRDVCIPILKGGAMALMSTLPSFMRHEPNSYSKYFCFSDLFGSDVDHTEYVESNNLAESSSKSQLLGAINTSHIPMGAKPTNVPVYQEPRMSLRHRTFQKQMKRKHLFFSLENYPDDGRIGPHIIAANFQAFLVLDLILGLIHYRRQLEPFSTVVHHIIYFFIVVHMRAGDMLSVFCILGTPIEASSIFLAYGRMFPHRRTPTVERLYLTCFLATRILYVSTLWHEVYFNYPDKSVAFLYTITISLHVYWLVLYTKTQKRFNAKQRSQHLSSVLQNLAVTAKKEFSAFENHLPSSTTPFNGLLDDKKKRKGDFRSNVTDSNENRLSVETDKIEFGISQSTARQRADRERAQML